MNGQQIDAVERAQEAMQARIAELEKLVYVPGLWKCAKCDFRLVQANLNAADGTVTARDEPGDKCPNCDSPLWRVTERDAGNEMARRTYELADRAATAEARIAELERWVADLQSGMYVNCVYCGHRYGPEDEVPATMADALKDHIEVCTRHPMSALKRRTEAAETRLAGIPHPTGSERFAGELAALGVPAPWRLCDEEVGMVLADDGGVAFQVDVNREQPDAAVSALASWILVAVNTCAGFKATIINEDSP